MLFVEQPVCFIHWTRI